MECYFYLVNKIVHIVNLFIYSWNVLSQSQKSFRYFLLLDHISFFCFHIFLHNVFK
jgi:hypothetical protein